MGMGTFREHAHILDATQLAECCYATDGGVGWGGIRPNLKKKLAAAALRRKPGIMSVFRALHLCRNDCSNGTVKIAPKDAFVHDLCPG